VVLKKLVLAYLDGNTKDETERDKSAVRNEYYRLEKIALFAIRTNIT